MAFFRNFIKSISKGGDNEKKNGASLSEQRSFMKAAKSGDTATIRRLVQRTTIDINCFDSLSGCTALHFASRRGHSAVVNFLLDSGANIDQQDNDGNTALNCACLNGHIDVITTLLECGAIVDSQNNDGNTALHEASTIGHIGVVVLLLESGSIVDCQNNYGCTSLHYACRSGNVEIVRELLGRGANKSIRDCNGKMAIDGARSRGHNTISLLE